jgi:hypothetical protein
MVIRRIVEWLIVSIRQVRAINTTNINNRKKAAVDAILGHMKAFPNYVLGIKINP